MSVNRYDASTGELTSIASGQRTWVGTKAAYNQAKTAGTLPNNAIIAITDDEQDHNHYSTDEVETGMYWIDGKPIYRKVIVINNPLTGWTRNLLAINVNESINSYLKMDNGSGYEVSPYYHNENDYFEGLITVHKNSHELSAYINVPNTITPTELIAIVEYTKTTD